MARQQKQYVNLSQYACNVIQSDLSIFGLDCSLPKFFNLILTNYGLYSHANVSRVLIEERESLHELLTKANLGRSARGNKLIDKNHIDFIIDVIVRDKIQQFQDKIKSYDKGAHFLFQLNDENYRILFETNNPLMVDEKTDWNNHDYYFGIAQSEPAARTLYIKTILEDYAEQPLYIRERFIFKETYDACQMAINNKTPIKISMLHSKDRMQFYVVPYKIAVNEDHTHSYLVGRSVPIHLGKDGDSKEDAKDERIYSSMRIDRFRVDMFYSRTSKLSNSEKEAVDERIQKSGVAFMMEQETEIVVRLTEKGKWRYDRIISMRPTEIKQASTDTMYDEKGYAHFLCTELQALHYFTRFCEDAEIISPESLREKMRIQYELANKLYTTGG